MSNLPIAASQSDPTNPLPEVRAKLIADAARHAEAEGQRLGLNAADAAAAVRRAFDDAFARGTLSRTSTPALRGAITDLLDVQAAIAAYFDRACRYAEAVRRRYHLGAGDGEEAVTHAFKQLRLHVRNIHRCKWAWLRQAIVNFLKSRVSHVIRAEAKEDCLRALKLAEYERRQAAYCPLQRAEAADRAEHLRAVFEACVARRPSAIRAAVARALLSDTYDASAIAAAYGKKVQWVSMIRRELLDYAAEHLPPLLAA